MVLKDPHHEALAALRADVPDGRPIALANLLRYADEVSWEGESFTGRELYRRYAESVMPALLRAGGRPTFFGVDGVLLDGPAGERWDDLVIIRYPNRNAVERFLASDELRAVAPCREAALADARLVVLTHPRTVGRLLATTLALTIRLGQWRARVRQHWTSTRMPAGPGRPLPW